jgi:hypothetical protein
VERDRSAQRRAHRTVDPNRPWTFSPAGVLDLQHRVGNRAVAQLFSAAQPKLTVGPARDRFEREADCVADTVMRNLPTNVVAAGPESDEDQVGRAVMERVRTTEEPNAPSEFGGGDRRYKEGVSGTNFSGLRIPGAPSPRALNRAISATAFTRGPDISIRDRLDRSSRDGRETLANGLVHVVQQGAASRPRRLMRELVKNAPTYEVRGESLATTMLTGVEKTELGLTIPSLNGTPFFGEGVQSNSMGSVAKPRVNLPGTTVEDSKGGIEHTNQFPKTREKVWDPFAEEGAEEEYEERLDPRDEMAKAAYETDRWLGWAENEPRNVFDWLVQLPPAGPWRENGVAKSKLVALVKQIGELSKVEVPDAESLLTGDTGRLIVTDPAGDASLLAHTRQHEHQHVGDHRGLIDEMFQPWDRFSRAHATRDTAIRADDRISAQSPFQTGGGFTPGADRISSELGTEMMRSGNAYHRKAEGSVPTITVASVTADTVTVHVAPHIRLTAGAIPPALYKWGRTRISG